MLDLIFGLAVPCFAFASPVNQRETTGEAHRESDLMLCLLLIGANTLVRRGSLQPIRGSPMVNPNRIAARLTIANQTECIDRKKATGLSTMPRDYRLRLPKGFTNLAPGRNDLVVIRSSTYS